MRAPRFVPFVLALLTLFWAVVAHAYEPPRLRGHVMDEAGALTQAEAAQLDRKLDHARRATGFHIVVFILPKLPEGETIDDVGYAAGNAWGVGSAKGDDGVLLIAALEDHKVRIETGKGVGGALTDVGSHHINRDVVGPLMKAGRVYDAMDAGTNAILKELVANTEGGRSDAGRDPRTRGRAAHEPPSLVQTLVGGAVLLVVIILAIVSPTFRHFLFFVLLFGRFGGGGGGGGGSGYGGGGGRFGGGGSSDDY